MPKRSKPTKVQAEKFIKDKSGKSDKMKATETVTVYVARVHGVTAEELRASGVL